MYGHLPSEEVVSPESPWVPRIQGMSPKRSMQRRHMPAVSRWPRRASGSGICVMVFDSAALHRHMRHGTVLDVNSLSDSAALHRHMRHGTVLDVNRLSDSAALHRHSAQFPIVAPVVSASLADAAGRQVLLAMDGLGQCWPMPTDFCGWQAEWRIEWIGWVCLKAA